MRRCGREMGSLGFEQKYKKHNFFQPVSLWYFWGSYLQSKQKKLFFRLLFCTLVHMVYIASYALHRSKRSDLIKCHSRRRVCIVCGGKWVEWDVTSGGLVQYKGYPLLKDCQWRPHDELSVTAPIILEEFTAQFSKEPATTILNKRKRNTVQNQSS